MSNASLTQVLTWLHQRHDQVMAEEQQAKDLLAGGDQGGYSQHMHRKAELLASLAKDAREVLGTLPDENLRQEILRSLLRFSQSAAYGLKLDSLFFMSALLYRDDHQVGEPDNLLVYLQELEAKHL
ncbi:MAG: hypothetical protein J5846_02615 [Desulfovibrio sp.]|nr:hypothetical protein [Desulfovibrio sp.]